MLLKKTVFDTMLIKSLSKHIKGLDSKHVELHAKLDAGTTLPKFVSHWLQSYFNRLQNLES